MDFVLVRLCFPPASYYKGHAETYARQTEDQKTGIGVNVSPLMSIG